MLFSEILNDERMEGREEGRMEGRKEARENLFKLMDLMEAGGDGDKIPLIRKSLDLLAEMYQKYHIEI